MRIIVKIFFINVFLLIIISGCSNPAADPIQYQTPALLSLPVAYCNSKSSYHDLLGLWTVSFDTHTLTASVAQNRVSAYHYDVTGYLNAPVISVKSFDPLTCIIDAEVSIANSLPAAGYDIRLIVFSDDYGSRLQNYEDWTNMWDIPGGSTINPFVAYAKLEPNRKFNRWFIHKEHVQIYLPDGGQYVSFAIDASYPSNCEEPYSIEDFTQGILYETVESQTIVTVDVLDWQDDVDKVSLYCPVITGEGFIDFINTGANHWELNLININGAPYGIYSGVIRAISDNPQQSILYDLVMIEVSEFVISEWTIFFYIAESDLYTWVNNNLNEMEVVGSHKGELNLVVLWDKSNTTEDVILEIAQDPNGLDNTVISPEIDDNGEVIPDEGLKMGEHQTLENYLRWGMRNYPSKHYGIIFFGHGSGPFSIAPGSKPFLACCHGLNVWDIRDACQMILDENQETGMFDFIGFESCLMSYIETAYCLKDVCNTGFASEMILWSMGLVYDDILVYLLDNIYTINSEELCSLIVDSCLSDGGCDTYAAWTSDEVNSSVMSGLDNFVLQLMNALPEYRQDIEECRFESDNWGENCEDITVTDIGVFTEMIISKNHLPFSLIDSAESFRADVDSAIIAHGHKGNGASRCYYSETGWQIWFPVNYNDPMHITKRDNYQSLRFNETLWDDFLSAFDS